MFAVINLLKKMRQYLQSIAECIYQVSFFISPWAEF